MKYLVKPIFVALLAVLYICLAGHTWAVVLLWTLSHKQASEHARKTLDLCARDAEKGGTFWIFMAMMGASILAMDSALCLAVINLLTRQ